MRKRKEEKDRTTMQRERETRNKEIWNNGDKKERE